jgi:hypothetical protein
MNCDLLDNRFNNKFSCSARSLNFFSNCRPELPLPRPFLGLAKTPDLFSVLFNPFDNMVITKYPYLFNLSAHSSTFLLVVL